MRLVAMSIPEEPSELPGWLERHLVGLDLAALVAELTAIHGPSEGPALAELLGNRRDAVLSGGLVALQPQALRQLLRHPHRLLELQELILRDGGPYWQQFGESDAEVASLALRGERRLATLLQTELPSIRLQSSPPRPPRFRTIRFLVPTITALAAAASVLLAVYWLREPLARRVLDQTPLAQAPPAWGWEKLGPPAADTTPSAYLHQLADAGAEWFRVKPTDPDSLAQRISEMRRGCSRLILAPHQPLQDRQERAWLVGKCRAWATSFDKALTDLESGRSVDDVRGEMDRVVEKLVAALREKANTL